MKRSMSIFYWGVLISFLGSLPPGLINLAAIQISGKQGNGKAMVYAAGSMLAEIIIVRIALAGMNWLSRRQRFFNILEWMTAGLLIAFSAACFIAANSMQEFTAILPELFFPPFLTGILLSAINPLHIPFWLGWSTVLMNKGVLRPGRYNWFIAGIGLGTMAGFTFFIYVGQYFLELFKTNQLVIDYVLGIVLFFAAFMYVRKMILQPFAIRYAKMMEKTVRQ